MGSQGIYFQASQQEKVAAFRAESDTPGAGAADLNDAGSYELGTCSEPWACEQGLLLSGPAVTHIMVQHPPASAGPSFWK